MTSFKLFRSNPRLRRHLLAATFFVASTLLLYSSLVADLSSSVLGTYSDGTSTIRDYESIERQAGTPFTLEHDALINAPEGLALSPGVQVANGMPPLFIWVLHYLVGFVAAWNIFILLGLALSGYTMFLLLERIGLHPLAAIFGGYVFGSSGYLVEKAFVGHGGLVQAWVLPLVALTLLRQQRSPTFRSAMLVGAALALAFYAHSYYGLIAGFLVACFVAVHIVRGPDRLWQFTLFDISLIVTAILLLPAAAAIVLQNTPIQEAGSHSFNALQEFGAKIPAYVAPNSRNPLLGDLVPNGLADRLEKTGEPSLFVGFTTLVLAGAWLVRLRRDAPEPLRKVGNFAAIVAVAAFVMSLPRLLDVGPFSLAMPSWFIGHVSTFWRVYARFGALGGLAVIVLAALALHVLVQRHGKWVAVVALVVVSMELLPGLPPTTLATDKVSASSRWLRVHPGGIVAHYPQPTDDPEAARLNGREYFNQVHHWHPLYSSATPRLPKRDLYIRVATRYIDSPQTAGLLAAERVRYVVIHDDVYRAAKQPPPSLNESFELVAKLDDSRIYRVVAPPADIDRTLASVREEISRALGFLPQTASPGRGFHAREPWQGEYWRWAGQDALVGVSVSDPEMTHTLSARGFSALNKPRRITLFDESDRELGDAVVEPFDTTIRIGPFRLPVGKHELRIHTTPGPERLGQSDPRIASVFLSPIVLTPFVDLPDASNATH